MTCTEINTIKEQCFPWANKPEDIDIFIIKKVNSKLFLRVKYRNEVEFCELTV